MYEVLFYRFLYIKDISAIMEKQYPFGEQAFAIVKTIITR